MRALSQAPYALRLLRGPVTRGVSLGHSHLLFSGGVVSLTRPGTLRMSNGLECDLPVPEPQAPIQIGGGRLACDVGMVFPGPVWDPKPHPRFAVSTHLGPASWTLPALAGLGPGLTPLGDDIAIGYLGAQALFSTGQPTGRALAASLAARTTSLSGTLLRLAAEGELPEAVHCLLESGDPEPLLAWGASSGRGILTGLGLYEARAGEGPARALDLILPFDPPRPARIKIREIAAASFGSDTRQRFHAIGVDV
jgi:hypothetical protein